VLSNNKTNNVPSTTKEKEKLYEETIQLKTLINNLRRELASVKHENLRKDIELNKKDKVLEDIVVDSQNNLYGGFSSQESFNKAKEANLLFKIKKQYKDLKKEFNEKCEEVENIKKLSKMTKLNEYTIEIKTLNEELQKIKTLYSHSLVQNEVNESQAKEIQNLQENFTKQHFIILSLQENIAKLNEDIRQKDDELNKFNRTFQEKENLIKKIKKELHISQGSLEKFTKEKRENSELEKLKSRYENQIADIMKESNRYRDLADRKDRQVRELESNVKRLSSLGASNNLGQKANSFNYKDLKYIQENPEEKFDNITLLLKSKLQEKVTENEKLKKRNKILEKKVRFIEQQIGVTIKDEMVENDELELEISFDKNNFQEGQNSQSPQKSQNIGNQHHQIELNSIEENKFGEVSKLEDPDDYQNYQGTDLYSDDQITEFTYILMKNFEAKGVTLSEIQQWINNLLESSSYNATTDIAKELIHKLSLKIFNRIKIKNEEELKQIEIFINSLYIISNGDSEAFKEKFMSLFDNMRTFTKSDGINYSKKLKKYLTQYTGYISNCLKAIDAKNTGYVTFLNFRKIIESINLRLKDKYIEYLIYVMKCNDELGNSIFNLKYDSLFKLLRDAQEDSKLETSEEFRENLNLDEEQEQSEIIITAEQFTEKVNKFLYLIDDYLKKNNITIRDLFKGKIFKIKEVETGEVFRRCEDEAVELKTFLTVVKDCDIMLGNLDVYCIFTKLKIVDDYEAISFTILEEDLKNFNTLNYFDLDDGNNHKQNISALAKSTSNMDLGNSI
jgi:hypothetical protein